MNVQKFAPVYRNTVGLIMGETVLVEVMKKFKDVGITDHGLVWNTDLIETLELENHINLARACEVFRCDPLRTLAWQL